MTFFIIVWALAVNYVAFKRGYYQLPKSTLKNTPFVRFVDLILCFVIYLAVAYVAAPYFIKYILEFLRRTNPDITTLPIPFLSFFQFFTMLTVFLLLQKQIYHHDSRVYKRIWKDRQYGSTRPIEFDLGIGALTWILSFPVVAILSNILEKLLKLIFKMGDYEQIAVRFVKVAAEASLPSLIFALLAVLVMAPFIEEFLFRGVLQTYLKKRMGPKAAILISALFFAFFHFSISQGLGNITLIFSLFILGGYLGFLYERQGSLWASIGLHMTFNTISALRILFAPES